MAQVSVQQAFRLAAQYAQGGRLAEAESVYRQILSARPDHIDSSIALGTIVAAQGRLNEATAILRHAAQQQRGIFQLHYNLGTALMNKGELDEAIVQFGEAISLRDSDPASNNNLGLCLQKKGALADAVTAYRRAIAAQPDYVSAYSNLGGVLQDQGLLEEAAATYRQAIALRPDEPEFHLNLGNVLEDQRRIDAAIAEYHCAIALRPDFAAPYNNLGRVLLEMGRADEAIAACRRAIALQPHLATAHNNLGAALRRNDQLEAAICAYRQALDLSPGYAEAHNNLGVALREVGDVDGAIGEYRQAIRLMPGFAEARHNLAFALLVSGNFEEGWEAYEARLEAPSLPRPRQFTQPCWDGSELGGRRLLLWAEQGLGDTIQFARYVPLVAGRGGQVIFQCYPQLRSLLSGQSGIDHLVTHADPLPDFDLHCPLLSVPGFLGTTLKTIPARIPYLFADEQRVQQWRERLHPVHDPRRKVGIVWAGSPHHKDDRHRSMRIEQFTAIAEVPDVRVISLQKDPVEPLPFALELLPGLDEGPDAFVDTAAVMVNLDLVITVDTAVAHLAGALGVPVWVLLPFAADWRWLLDREDTPWYPTMQLFRQHKPGDWTGVIELVAAKLQWIIEAR